ncbi:MAG: UDP-N-acetylmuramate--L-alanine ligase, partial [Candidatus Omnitrophota bacterium]
MKRHIHFIGIGGIGVSGLAQLALKRGEKVSGSDVKVSPLTQRLLELGVQVYVGHRPEQIQGSDLVVYSSAIRPDNPELTAARAQGIPVERRAEFLSELMADKTVITVTGAHGKTTTSSLAAKMLISAGLHPSVAVGGILREDGDNAKWGESRYFVAEADESDGSFLCYHPTYSVITNIDEEHLDYYHTYARLTEAFGTFIAQTKPQGCVFYCREDEVLTTLVESAAVRRVSFGFSPAADFYAQDIRVAQGALSFVCLKKQGCLGELTLSLTGRHHVLNALAVMALGLEMGLSFDGIRQALRDFQGVERRFQVKRADQDIFIVDDYAHHPTEIRVTIEAAKACPCGRVVAVFQPHRYTRTQLLMDKFAECFRQSDCVIVTDIYPAGEDPIEGVTGERLMERIRQKVSGRVEYIQKE